MPFQVALAILILAATVAMAQPGTRWQQSAAGADVGGVRVELYEPVPPIEPMQTEIVLPASVCRLRLSPDVADVTFVPPRAGPDQCGGEDLVRLEAVILPDHSRVAVSPPALLRCSMAEAVVDWARSEIPAIGSELGSKVTALDNFSSYHCRPRNNVRGAKLSEHGLANALDLRGVKLATGRLVDFTDTAVDRRLRERTRAAVCARFSTVLGPGSDPYHENHIHLDLLQRRGGYRMCQWDVRDPVQIASAPLPRPRPKLTDREATDANGSPAVIATLSAEAVLRAERRLALPSAAAGPDEERASTRTPDRSPAVRAATFVLDSIGNQAGARPKATEAVDALGNAASAPRTSGPAAVSTAKGRGGSAREDAVGNAPARKRGRI